MSPDTDVLETLYTVISRALCEEDGHKWRHVQPKPQPDAASARGFSGSARWETCLRCGETRMQTKVNSNTVAAHETQYVGMGGE